MSQSCQRIRTVAEGAGGLDTHIATRCLPMELEEAVQQTVEFVHHNQAWAVPVVFALAFGESLAFISLLLPAWGALVAIGALIGAGALSFTPIWIAAAIGAALGD